MLSPNGGRPRSIVDFFLEQCLEDCLVERVSSLSLQASLRRYEEKAFLWGNGNLMSGRLLPTPTTLGRQRDILGMWVVTPIVT